MKILYFFVFLLPFFSCGRDYNPALRESDNDVLVVEANLDPGDDSTIIRLTRTLHVNDTAKIKVENNAQVIVEGRDNTFIALIPKGKGYYAYPGLRLTIGNEYRLRIKTVRGEEYLSDYVQAKRSPSIDSLTWGIDTIGLHVYVHTHDPARRTGYYRWDAVEAWMIRMPFFASVIYENGTIRDARWPDDNMWECYFYDSTQSLILATTEKLADDIVSYKEIKTIPYHHEKIHWQYGILAKQYAIDEQAHKYFSLMKENTERIGTLFSPQPFELRGNIRSVKDTLSYALGYVTASTISRQKMIVHGAQLVYWRSVPGIKCEDSVISVKNSIADFRYYFDQLGYFPFSAVGPVGGSPTHYQATKRECVDCRARGAVTTYPYFW